MSGTPWEMVGLPNSWSSRFSWCATQAWNSHCWTAMSSTRPPIWPIAISTWFLHMYLLDSGLLLDLGTLYYVLLWSAFSSVLDTAHTRLGDLPICFILELPLLNELSPLLLDIYKGIPGHVRSQEVMRKREPTGTEERRQAVGLVGMEQKSWREGRVRRTLGTLVILLVPAFEPSFSKMTPLPYKVD